MKINDMQSILLVVVICYFHDLPCTHALCLSLMAPKYCTTDRDHTLNKKLKQMLPERDFDVQCMGAITRSSSPALSLSLCSSVSSSHICQKQNNWEHENEIWPSESARTEQERESE